MPKNIPPNRPSLSIGELADATGCEVPTIRYYEQVGILDKAARTQGGHRCYTDSQRQRLAFVRQCRDLGFSLEEVKELLHLADNREGDCGSVDRIVSLRLADVRAKIAHLLVLEAELKRMGRGCRQGKIADCRIVQALSNSDVRKPVARGRSLRA